MMMKVALLCGAIVAAQAACPSFTVGMCQNQCTGQCFPEITKAPIPSPTLPIPPSASPTKDPTRSPRVTSPPSASPTDFPTTASPTARATPPPTQATPAPTTRAPTAAATSPPTNAATPPPTNAATPPPTAGTPPPTNAATPPPTAATPPPTNAATPPPTNAATPPPTAATPPPTNAATPPPTNAATPPPTAATPPPTNAATPPPTNAATPPPTAGATPPPTAATPPPTNAATPPPTNAATPPPTTGPPTGSPTKSPSPQPVPSASPGTSAPTSSPKPQPTKSPIPAPTRSPQPPTSSPVPSPTMSPTCPDLTVGKCGCDCVGVPTIRMAMDAAKDSSGNLIAVDSDAFENWVNSFEQKFFRDFRTAATTTFPIPEIQSAADFDLVFKGFMVHHACLIPKNRVSSKAADIDLKWANRCFIKPSEGANDIGNSTDRHAAPLQTVCDLNTAATTCETVVEFSVVNHYRPGWDTSLETAMVSVRSQIRTAADNVGDGSFMKDYNSGQRARAVVNQGIWIAPTPAPTPVPTPFPPVPGSSGSAVVPFLMGCIAAVGMALVA
eukprot:TRINITY_DN4100_c1_g1_i6.p1 TRINITY_DN4100_c1_g1~~TRINITY_DN4100_c1_g1_i6.p1  ORF type:complete len:557 (+),score=105.49 TRINITY_DN4100_c1_g1_i6:84-1754(+)